MFSICNKYKSGNKSPNSSREVVQILLLIFHKKIGRDKHCFNYRYRMVVLDVTDVL